MNEVKFKCSACAAEAVVVKICTGLSKCNSCCLVLVDVNILQPCSYHDDPVCFRVWLCGCGALRVGGEGAASSRWLRYRVDVCVCGIEGHPVLLLLCASNAARALRHANQQAATAGPLGSAGWVICACKHTALHLPSRIFKVFSCRQLC